jgi:plastocyanin
MHPYSGSSWLRGRRLSLWVVAPLLIALAFAANSCNCDHEVRIVKDQGAEGMVPGTLHARPGQTICFTNQDNVAHTVTFTNSPDEAGPAPKDLVLAPGEKKRMRVHPSKPLAAYECHIVPPASSTGLWPPTEPQVVVE